MKNKLAKMMLSMLFLFGISFLFIQCEDESMISEIMAEEILEARGGTPPSSVASMDICECIAQKYPVEALNDKEVEALKFMYEEEKLARDVYLTMAEKYDLRIFSNISKAEEKHMNSVKCLINKYGLEGPDVEGAKGSFTNQKLQTLYNDLVMRGNTELTEALKVGATIEDLDINDLTLLLEDEEIDNKDLSAVFESLRKGSRNHMRAFTRTLNRYDEQYEVSYISEEMYDDIVKGGQERGNGICSEFIDCQNAGNNGNGKGMKGKNNGNCNGNMDGTNCQGQRGNQDCDGTGIGKNGNGRKGNNGN